MTARLLRLMDLLAVLDNLHKLETPTTTGKPRSTLLLRERRAWPLYIKPMLGDGTFKGRFRMHHVDFKILVDHLRPELERDTTMGALRNGAVPVEYQVGLTLRWLAGASMYQGMDGHVIARSTAYQTAFRVIKAINDCTELDCKWPATPEDVADKAAHFEKRCSVGVIRKCVGAMDGLFVRTIRPTTRDTAEPNSYYSGHKKGFGMNFQRICDAEFRIIITAWTMNSPGCQNDRTAFKFSGFEQLLQDLPPDYFILGDAAYPASDRVLVPYPGTNLPTFHDAFNFWQSQGRISIEQTFVIMVSPDVWGILWRPMDFGLGRVVEVVGAVVRVHNFC
ncbi:unnamed protein product, partial [Pylaiella littoralis]